MRLHIIRHGDPDYSIDSLTPRGRREAECLQHWVTRVKPDRAYHSPLGRARLTAELALAGSGLTSTEEIWTAELHGAQAAESTHTWWDVDGHALRNKDYLKGYHWEDQPHLFPTRAEQEVNRVAADSDAFLARHGLTREDGAYRVGPSPVHNIAVFCHGGLGVTWLAHLLAVPAPLIWSGFFMHPSSVTTLLFDERVPGIATPRILHFGDLAHLHQANIEPSQAGIKANYS